jgi:hypothetical protein
MNHSEIGPHTCQDGYNQIKKITTVTESLEELEPSYSTSGNVK